MQLSDADKASKPAAKERLLYKAIQGDQVDELLAKYINQMEVSVPVRRLEFGYYLFGTRKIYAKVLNNKLVVRVGGGYMSFAEFIDCNAVQEQKKIEELEANGNWNLEDYIQNLTNKMNAPEEQARQTSKWSLIFSLLTLYFSLDTMNVGRMSINVGRAGSSGRKSGKGPASPNKGRMSPSHNWSINAKSPHFMNFPDNFSFLIHWLEQKIRNYYLKCKLVYF